jgi:hypothetical protein
MLFEISDQYRAELDRLQADAGAPDHAQALAWALAVYRRLLTLYPDRSAPLCEPDGRTVFLPLGEHADAPPIPVAAGRAPKQPLTVKLDLNLPALERLLGGDAELEVQLRKQIVAEFTERHLAGVVKTEEYKKVLDHWRDAANKCLDAACQAEITRQVGELVKVGPANGWHWEYRLVPKVTDKIKELVEGTVAQTVSAKMADVLKEDIDRRQRQLRDHVETKVKEVLDQDIARLVKDGVQQRLQAALEVKP